MKKFIAIFIFSFTASAANFENLETKNFLIEIKPDCDDGSFDCDKMIYKGTNKKVEIPSH